MCRAVQLLGEVKNAEDVIPNLDEPGSPKWVVSPASQLCGSQPYRDVQPTSIVCTTTLGLWGYHLLWTSKSSNTTLVHRLRTADRQDSSIQHATNEFWLCSENAFLELRNHSTSLLFRLSDFLPNLTESRGQGHLWHVGVYVGSTIITSQPHNPRGCACWASQLWITP